MDSSLAEITKHDLWSEFSQKAHAVPEKQADWNRTKWGGLGAKWETFKAFFMKEEYDLDHDGTG